MTALDTLMTSIEDYLAEDRTSLSGAEAADSLIALTAGISRLTAAQFATENLSVPRG